MPGLWVSWENSKKKCAQNPNSEGGRERGMEGGRASEQKMKKGERAIARSRG